MAAASTSAKLDATLVTSASRVPATTQARCRSPKAKRRRARSSPDRRRRSIFWWSDRLSFEQSEDPVVLDLAEERALLRGAELVDEVRAGARGAVMRVVDRALQLLVLGEEAARLLDGEARVGERLVELGARPLVGLEEHHLDAAVDVHLAVAGRLDRAEDELGVLARHVALDAVRDARARHAAERLDRDDHVGVLGLDVVDDLADLHVALAATELVVVEGRRESGDVVHVGEVPALEADEGREGLEHSQERVLSGAREEDVAPGGVLPLETLAAGVLVAQRDPALHVAPSVPEEVEEPVRDRLDEDLAALLLDEPLELVVAVALGRHGPELADDADGGLGAETVDRDRRQLLAAPPEGLEHRLPVLEGVDHDLAALADRGVRRARVDLVGADPVAHDVEHIAREERHEERLVEGGVEDDPVLLARRLLDGAALLHEEDAEPLVARVAERLPVLRHIRAEA